ncbi:MAG: DUF1848 domain-containing protein [Chlorobiaceae bacterium]
MIISASRRTDIPAFYGEWFMNRLRAGEVLVRNPMNTKQVTRVYLSPEKVDCIVFWTKNPRDFITYLPQIDSMGYKYYFLFTLTSYDKSVELNVDKKKKILDVFKRLSDTVGKEKVIWRYDPILLTSVFDKDYHYKWFEYLAQNLSGYTDECIISFLSFYNKVKRNMRDIDCLLPEMPMIELFAECFSEISRKQSISLFTCSHEFDLNKYGIGHAKCVDDQIIEKITGHILNLTKDKSQREECGCVESKDIGIYNSCTHGCLYCYANCNEEKVAFNISGYDPYSSMLCDTLRGNEKIVNLIAKSNKIKVDEGNQLNVFE